MRLIVEDVLMVGDVVESIRVVFSGGSEIDAAEDPEVPLPVELSLKIDANGEIALHKVPLVPEAGDGQEYIWSMNVYDDCEMEDRYIWRPQEKVPPPLVQLGVTNCPSCGSQQIVPEKLQAKPTHIVAKMTCRLCAARWDATYVHAGVGTVTPAQL